METMGNSKPAIEANKTYRIEHLPGLDVVENLNYPNQEDQDVILKILRNNRLGEGSYMGDLLLKIFSIRDSVGYKCFYVKIKRESKKQVDFRKGRATRDPINFNLRHDFDKKARYALVGVLNEIILARKIKEIITLSAVQKLAKQHGFAGMKFSEPIFALVDRKNSSKYLIYRNMVSIDEPKNCVWEILVKDLRKIFLQNGIYPHDLKSNQFMVVEQDGEPCVVLIDTEAYTEVNKPPHNFFS
ncbi:MAG: hypothetical protein WC884_02480 [Candidatus Paceibacterota bacterium]